jgi:hypothetical protein
MTYIALKKIIESGWYDKEDIKTKMDVFYLGNRITKAQYEELMTLVGE